MDNAVESHSLLNHSCDTDDSILDTMGEAVKYLWKVSEQLGWSPMDLVKLAERSVHDSLVPGALSRIAGIQHLTDLFNAKQRFTLAYLDLNGLKRVNDQYGHHAGDQLIAQFGTHLVQSLGAPTQATVIRLGGDEFVIVFHKNSLSVTSTMEHLKKTLPPITVETFDRETRMYGQTTLYPTFAYGVRQRERRQVGHSNNVADALAKLLSAVDAAMYADKEAQRRQRSSC